MLPGKKHLLGAQWADKDGSLYVAIVRSFEPDGSDVELRLEKQ